MTNNLLLDDGDDIQEGDEYWNNANGWCQIYVKGLPKGRKFRASQDYLLIRRPTEAQQHERDCHSASNDYD